MMPDASADVVFISGGLKAAMNTRSTVRDNILGDVCQALNCKPEALDFLFEGGGKLDDDEADFDFPDAERRRKIIRDNHLDAAE